MKFALINSSTVISNGDANHMALACDVQMKTQYAFLWDRNPVHQSVIFYADPTKVPADVDETLSLVDEIPEAPGALAYHSIDPVTDKAFGRIGAKLILDNGGVALFNPAAPQTVTVASALSHEILETAEDLDCNDWCDGANDVSLAKEIADPVESDIVPIYLHDGTIVGVSNFVTPAWFDPNAKATVRMDLMHKLTGGPGTIDAGGYKTQRVEGATQQINGDKRPEWLKAAKTKGGRGSLRLATAKSPK
jgi:hypothetical protein